MLIKIQFFKTYRVELKGTSEHTRALNLWLEPSYIGANIQKVVKVFISVLLHQGGELAPIMTNFNNGV